MRAFTFWLGYVPFYLMMGYLIGSYFTDVIHLDIQQTHWSNMLTYAWIVAWPIMLAISTIVAAVLGIIGLVLNLIANILVCILTFLTSIISFVIAIIGIILIIVVTVIVIAILGGVVLSPLELINRYIPSKNQKLAEGKEEPTKEPEEKKDTSSSESYGH